ncbi:MAG: ADP-forming succinate--CoA ligase subunit beta [Candidatus Jordarchaeaceae archaeon]
MHLFEYECKKIFQEHAIPVPKGSVADSSREAVKIAESLGGPVAVKAQILIGGRGKLGGVKFAEGPKEAGEKAAELIGSYVGNIKVERVLVEEKIDFRDEFYVGITIDRSAKRPVALVSRFGGVDIEQVAFETPDRVHKHYINPISGLNEEESLNLFKKMRLEGEELIQVSYILKRLWEITRKYDGELIEINPLVKTVHGKFLALDAKLVIDDNALFRHPEFKTHQTSLISGLEAKALAEGLSYVQLDGDIGVIGNGAGLTMATMDLLSLYGGKPADFLDLGGGATRENVSAALKILLSNERVKVVLINVLGGITRCDEVAMGIINSYSVFSSRVPLVVRMVGTNEEEGRKLLKKIGIETFGDMEEAAQRAVELSRRF